MGQNIDMMHMPAIKTKHILRNQDAKKLQKQILLVSESKEGQNFKLRSYKCIATGLACMCNVLFSFLFFFGGGEMREGIYNRMAKNS